MFEFDSEVCKVPKLIPHNKMVLQIIKGFLYFALAPGVSGDTSGWLDTVESAKVHKLLIPDKIVSACIVNEYSGIVYLYPFTDSAK